MVSKCYEADTAEWKLKWVGKKCIPPIHASEIKELALSKLIIPTFYYY